MGSGGGGIGSAFGCKNGKMKQELIFDYEAGFEFAASPIPLTIAFHQNVGFLREWPTHHSKFFFRRWKFKTHVGHSKIGIHVSTNSFERSVPKGASRCCQRCCVWQSDSTKRTNDV